MCKSKNIFLVLLLLAIISCTSADKGFDQQKWLRNNDVNDTSNPRAYMTEDLLSNYLKVGFTKQEVLALLGKPYRDTVENRLPKGVKMPDSISFEKEENLKQDQSKMTVDQINKFYKLNAKPDTLLLYPVGWSTIDPNFLAIKFDNKGIVVDFWIEQH